MTSEPPIRIRVALVMIRDGKILLVEHENFGKRYWLLPGGGLEQNETLVDCGIREAREETGLAVEMGDLLMVSESIPSVDHPHVVVMYFRAEITGGEMLVGDDDVLTDVRWFDISELKDLTLFPDITHELLEAIAGRIPRRSLGTYPAGPDDLMKLG